MSRANEKFFSLNYPLGLSVADDTSYFQIQIVDKIKRPFPVTSNDFLNAEKRSSGGDVFGTNLQKTRGTIILPMPLGISNQNSVDWADGKINFIESLASEGINNLIDAAAKGTGFEDALKAAGAEGQAFLDSLTRGIGNANINQNARQLVVQQILRTFGSQVSANQLISRASGQVLNPYLELLFNGVNLREFDFDFVMTPRSPQESTEIKKIIRELNRAKTPSYGSNGAFIQQPSVFKVGFFQGNQPHPFLFNVKTCAMTSMSVNYSNSSQSNFTSYGDGTPTSLTMNLSFTELSPIYREDYDVDDGLNGVGY